MYTISRAKQVKQSILLAGSIFFLLSSFVFSWERIKSLEIIDKESIGTVTFDGKTLIDKLLNQQETTKMKRSLILHYCDVVLHKEHAKDGNSLEREYTNYTYDPKQSLFVYTLCVNLDEQSKNRKILGKTYTYRNYKKEFDDIQYTNPSVSFALNDIIKEDVDLNVDLRQIPKQESLDGEQAYSPCNPVTTMQGCNFSTFLPDIFETLMNEYGNIKLWSLYGYQMIKAEQVDTLWNTQDPAFKKVVARFADTFFWDDLVDKAGNAADDKTMPCMDSTITYLDSSDPVGQSAHCSHPKTYEFVATTLKSAKKLIDKTVLIDAKKLMEQPCAWEERGVLLMRCAFSTYGNESFDSDTKSFSNLLLNELMWYNLFVTYYTQMLLYDPSYHPLTIWSASFSYQRWVTEYTTMLYEQQLAMQAIKQMNRMITQVVVHFPLHVWLLAYYEDLLTYRKTITKAYTPFHQLSYKRRNVQSCGD